MIKLAVKFVRKGAVAAGLPRYATPGAAGLDLQACLDRPVSLTPGERQLIPTGIAVAIPVGYAGFIFPRSGLASKYGLSMANAVGVIDSDYRGELKCPVINFSQSVYTIQPGERIGQLVLMSVAQAELVVVDQLDETQRGQGGFGSTGK